MILTKPSILIALITLLPPTMASLRAEDRMRAGMWDVTTTLDGKSLGATTTCYTPAMVQFANSSLVSLREAAEKRYAKLGCTLKEYKQDEHALSMVTICGSKTHSVVSKYSGDTFETVDKTTEAGVTKIMNLTGRRTGDCK